MEFRHLNTFKVVAEVKGFTRAAEVLGYAQSSVTAQIQALEEELGVPLFNRLGKKIKLTQAGERLLPYVIEIQKLLHNAKADAVEGQIPQGTLTIGAPETLCTYRLPALLQEYRRLYPDVKIILRPGLCHQLRQQVRTGELDLSFLLDERVQATDLHVETLCSENVLLVAPPFHPLASRAAVSPQDLKEEDVLLTETGCPYRVMLETQLSGHGVFLDKQVEFGSLEAIKQCVISGIGLAQLPEVVVRAELESGKLVALNWAGEPFPVETQVLYHKNRWNSPAMNEFLRMTTEWFCK